MSRKGFTKLQRDYVFRMFGGKCAYCGCYITKDNMQIDHVIPLAKGGADNIDNAYPACRSCNHYKSTLTVKQFKGEIGKWLERLERDSVTYKNAVRFGLILPIKHHKIEFYFERKQQEGGW